MSTSDETLAEAYENWRGGDDETCDLVAALRDAIATEKAKVEAAKAANVDLRRKNMSQHATLVAVEAAREEVERSRNRWHLEVQRLRDEITALADEWETSLGVIIGDRCATAFRALLAPQVQDKPEAGEG